MNDKKKMVDHDLIRELAGLLTETGLTEIEIQCDDTRIRVARNGAPVAAAAAPAAAPAEGPDSARSVAEPAEHPGTVHSPMVGTAYRSPEPGQRPYVEVGHKVHEGQTVLIVEAMKTMNHIPAPCDGTIVKIMVEDGQPVEYGEPLMIIE